MKGNKSARGMNSNLNKINESPNTDHLIIAQLHPNCMYIERLSKKAKNGDFNNFACSKINNLQAPNSQF